MFRCSRIPVAALQARNSLNQTERNSRSRLYNVIHRYYSAPRSDLCPPPGPRTNTGGGKIIAAGALALVAAGATIGYAKYDPEFRKQLVGYVPFTDDVIKFVFQEEKTFGQQFQEMIGGTDKKASQAKTQVKEGFGKTRKPIEVKEEPCVYNAPTPIFPKVSQDAKPAEEYTEIRMQEIKDKSDEVVEEVRGVVKSATSTPTELIAGLETRLSEQAKLAIEAYNSSIFAIKNYIKDVEIVVEESIDTIDPDVWPSLKRKSQEKEKIINKAHGYANEAMKAINELKKTLARRDLGVDDIYIDRTKSNIERIQNDLMAAKQELDEEIEMSKIADKYWPKVAESRKHFGKELEALFPSINLHEKNLSISDADMDLFVLHAVTQVLYYQKELARLETIADQKLNTAIEEAKRKGSDVLSTEQVCMELEKEKRKLEMEYRTKCLKMRQQSENELRTKLKLQSEAFCDHLEDAVKTREMELERLLNRKFDEELTEERCKYKLQVAAMVGKLRGMEEAIKSRSETDKTTHQAQVLWSACQALIKSVKAGCPGMPWADQLRPLKPEINAVKSAAEKGDELVGVVIEAIPKEAKERGVYPEDALRERFLKVEKVARSMALLPEEGGGLHLFLLSYLQSLLLVKSTSPIPQAELNNEHVDFSNLTTNEILQRARYWLDRGDFAQSLRYMNLLKGAPRAVSKQWMTETRILLETQQAANTLMAYAAASGLQYM